MRKILNFYKLKMPGLVVRWVPLKEKLIPFLFDRKKKNLYIFKYFFIVSENWSETLNYKNFTVGLFRIVYIPHYQSEVLSFEFHFKVNRKLGLK